MEKGLLSGLFKKVVVGGALVLAGALMTEPLVLCLGHFNVGGMALINAINPYLQSFFDGTGITNGLLALASWISPHGLAQAGQNLGGTELINAAGKRVLGID